MSKTASAVVTVANKLGLHARPATIFVQAASTMNSRVTVRRTDQDDSVDGKSIMQMMMLAATQGTKIEITANGADAKEAVATLVQLVKSGFQED
ncbi:MAG: HPr family phosphocarrier protein [Planctomycetota bacterium]